MYELNLGKKAAKYFSKMPRNEAKRLTECFRNLEKDPFGLNTKALTGLHKGKRRYRIGDIRVVYKVDRQNRIVYVTAILPRGDVYKNFLLF